MKLVSKCINKQCLGVQSGVLKENKHGDRVLISFVAELVTVVDNKLGNDGYDPSINIIDGVIYQVRYTIKGKSKLMRFDFLSHCQEFVNQIDDPDCILYGK